MNYFDDYVQSISQSSKRTTLICRQRLGTGVIDVGLLFILRLASRLVPWAWQVRLFTSNLDNCNEVNSRLPHRAHISKVSCSEAICSWVNIYKHPTGFCFDRATNFVCWHPGTILRWRLAKNKHSCLRVNIPCSKSDASFFSNTFDGDYNSSLSDN